MTRCRSLSVPVIVSLALSLALGGCGKGPKKPDPTKGAVAGTVFCADTGKPARFASVFLSVAPKEGEKLEQGNPLPATESAVTDLDGHFRMEAVEPGRYYAFATLEGYLDPELSIDFGRLSALGSDRERNLDAIAQWKDHLTAVIVSVHRTANLSLSIERGAELHGTVSFDDGSPAIGMRFQLFRKTVAAGKINWSEAGVALFSPWALSTTSDGHGRYSVSNLPAGEYTVCALMPADSEDSAARVCLGNVFRRKDAKTVKVGQGEIANDIDIEIPLDGLHTVAGTVSALADGHAIHQATVRLLYADDREKLREVSVDEEGSFSFAYVPEDKYILQVTGAEDLDPTQAADDASSAEARSSAALRYAGKELPVTVLDDVDEIQVQLTPAQPDNSARQ